MAEELTPAEEYIRDLEAVVRRMEDRMRLAVELVRKKEQTTAILVLGFCPACGLETMRGIRTECRCGYKRPATIPA